ncbi:MAG: FAD-dependent oxidoreductase [Bryobacteraceae bacterium]|nr:FAD-dependent oxidoreductase [Bryobacteraceae bacterium]
MTKPVLLTVDDDAAVLRAVERDLRKQYGANYRVMRADSGAAALDTLRQLQLRNQPVALLLADHRMPEMNGVEFLAQGQKLYPDARRVLLTAYADTDAAIRAINEVRLHHYLLKPWDPPEERLFPVLDDLLDDWSREYRAPFEGLRVLGTRWARPCYDLRDFLSRNQVPFRWMDLDRRDPETVQLLEALGGRDLQLPAVVLPDGQLIEAPTTALLAERIGLHRTPGRQFYDLAIVGGGPGGLAAAVYAASEGLKTLMIEREAPGGQAGLSSRIENYLGFPAGVSGAKLTRDAVVQAKKFGVEILAPQDAACLRAEGPYRIVGLREGGEVSCHGVVLATGVQWRRLDVPGMDRLVGAGVYYGAGTTEAVSCANEDVFIVGGANSAGQAAMHFSQYARQVTMLVRGDSLAATMSDYLIQQIESTPNIAVWTRTQVAEVHGEARLEAITIATKEGESRRVDASALFIFIGAEPRTDWLDGVVERDAKGFILTGQDLLRTGKRPRGWNLDRDPWLLETSLPGVFAVGDVRHGSVKRVASSVGEGSVAIQFVHQYLATL